MYVVLVPCVSCRRVFSHCVPCVCGPGALHSGRDQGSLECRVLYSLSAVHGRPVLLLGHGIFTAFLFWLPRHLIPMLGTSRLDFGPGSLEVERTANPKVSGLPSRGAMRDLPTTPLGQRWWLVARHFCEAPALYL